MEWTSVIVIDSAIDEWCGRLAHMWVQALDTLSNCCDNNNIHSAIWMKFFIFCIAVEQLIIMRLIILIAVSHVNALLTHI